MAFALAGKVKLNSLRFLSPTWGDDYNEEELARLHRFVSESYRLPDFAAGREAMIEFAECDPLDWFADWQMVTITEEGTDRESYTVDTQNELTRRFGSSLKCYFLWNNSD